MALYSYGLGYLWHCARCVARGAHAHMCLRLAFAESVEVAYVVMACIAMALCSNGPYISQLWPYVVMAVCSYGLFFCRIRRSGRTSRRPTCRRPTVAPGQGMGRAHARGQCGMESGGHTYFLYKRDVWLGGARIHFVSGSM